MDVLYDIVVTINTYLSNYVLIILLVAMGLVFTIRTKFVQVRFFGEGMRRVFGEFNLFGGKKKSGISSPPPSRRKSARATSWVPAAPS